MLDELLTDHDIADFQIRLKATVIAGIASSGIHSNGLTLARRAFEDLSENLPETGRTVGEELLEPTKIYVHLTIETSGVGFED
jgi:phosphoribosylformylglycinamidine cyclo-ligase